MSRYIYKRLLLMIPVVIMVAVLIFTIMYFTPGDPAIIILGPNASLEQLAAKRAEKKKKKTLTIEENGQTVTKEVTGGEANKLRLELARKREAELYKDERTTPLQQ